MATNSSAAPSTSNDLKDSRWYFTAEQLANSPSRKQGINADQELSYRQQTAYLIQEMGQRLAVNGIATASLFLAAKVEEQPRKLEHVIKIAHLCLNTEFSSEMYNEQAQDLVFNENVLLQTLGFDVAIDHPHTHVVKTCHLVKACKDLAQTSYFLASNSLHLTSMCLQYKPTVVACFCIYLACKWSRWEIPQSTEGKHWFHYVDTSVTLDLLKQLTDEFLAIYEKSPARLKSKLNSIKAMAQSARMNEPQRPISDANGSSTQAPTESTRRTESYSSHHRHHSSSGSSHHNHHSKSQLPSTDSVDHKLPSSHKQAFAGTSSSSGHPSNRPPRTDRPQIIAAEGQIHPSHSGSSKQSMQVPGAPRSSSRPPPHGVPILPGSSSSSQRLPHGPHDQNYHKSRNSMLPVNSVTPSGHKSVSKSNDPQRNLLKDSSGRLIDPSKMALKHSGSANTTNSSSMYPGTGMPVAGVDLTRNVQQVHPPAPQRPFVPPSTTHPPAYNQNTSSRSSSSSIKYEQSVHQPQILEQPGQKQSLEPSLSNQRQTDESSNVKVEQMEICSPTKYSYSNLPQTVNQAQSLQSTPSATIRTQNKASSIFSPEWNDKVSSHSVVPPSLNSKAGGDVNLDRPSAIALNIKPTRDSPKKSDRERRSETPKKEKNRPESQHLDSNKSFQPADKRISSKKVSDSPSQLMGQSVGPSTTLSFDGKAQQALNLTNMKRPTDTVSRLEDERDFKIRKVEPQSPPKLTSEQRSLFSYDQGGSGDASRAIKSSFSSTVNGIETDPDLVRNLLKESLCTENKFSIKPDHVLEYSDIKPFEPISDTLPAQLLQNESPVKEMIKEEAALLPATIDTGVDQYGKSKAEKKKKKEKHKHKEKDKSKDKEERKKHKKDKERSKERERSSGSEVVNHVKLTIPKEKLNLASLGPTPAANSELKIKITKDRIKAELSQYQTEENVNTPTQTTLAPPPQPSSLKIKISKDKIESISHHPQHHSSSYSSSSSHHSHHSSKKKDRDRDKDRDKDKKRSSGSGNSNDHKQNGSGGGNSGISDSSATSASTKNQSSNPNKMQPYSTNMSRLFGEMPEDDTIPAVQRHSFHEQRTERSYTYDRYPQRMSTTQYDQQTGNTYYSSSNKD